jgi:serine/threonine protein kinase
MLVAEAARSSVMAWSSSQQQVARDGSQVDPHGPTVFSTERLPEAPRTDPSLSSLDTGPFKSATVPPAGGELLAGRFRLRAMLGRGAMGEVYAAYDELLGVQLAVKRLLPALAADHAYLRQLHHEIVVARRVSHPNVCRVYDLGHSGDVHFITMELVAGETLGDRIQRGPLSVDATGDILIQIAAALDAAHGKGVVHRDLKPSNIMIDERGHVTVMDFGLARDLETEKSLYQGPVGTPAFWAPEQGRGERATAASDLYTLGVIACCMFAGAPHTRKGDGDALASVPPAYRGIIGRCLEADPGKRTSSAQALRKELKAIRRRRPRGRLYVSMLSLAVGAAGVIAWAWSRPSYLPPPATALSSSPPASVPAPVPEPSHPREGPTEVVSRGAPAATGVTPIAPVSSSGQAPISSARETPASRPVVRHPPAVTQAAPAKSGDRPAQAPTAAASAPAPTHDMDLLYNR